jgi:hypothetical protein
VCGLGGKIGDSYSMAIDHFGDLRTGKFNLPAAQLGSVIVDNLGSGLIFDHTYFFHALFHLCMIMCYWIGCCFHL